MSAKTERIEARLSVEQKAIFTRAAALTGKSLSDFVVSSAYEAAKQTIQENEYLSLSARDSEIFVKAVLKGGPPNQNLKRAAKRFKENTKNQ